MSDDEIDRAEVDQLVKQLAERRKASVPTPVKAPVVAAAAAAEASSPSEPPRPAPESRAPSRWSRNRLLMPSLHHGGNPRKVFAFASAIPMSLPAMPRIAFPVLTESQLEVITARMFVGLGLTLGALMPLWPYARTQSWGFALYLFAVTLVIVTGIWGSKLTWDTRLSRSHTLAILTVIWGLGLVTVAVLPRLGFVLG